jgi:hypothetical protein
MASWRSPAGAVVASDAWSSAIVWNLSQILICVWIVDVLTNLSMSREEKA